jgi:nicotinamide-nucleotide amidase
MNAAEKMVAEFSSRGLVCAVAESCTGGAIGSAIVSVSGASAVFAGGVISYSNDVKREVLKVSASTLERHGAVSAETASEMASGVRALTNADFSVSVTGIAGPGGGSAEKPVGLVWFGLAGRDGVRAERMIFSGDRERVRASAIEHALLLLLAASSECS